MHLPIEYFHKGDNQAKQGVLYRILRSQLFRLCFAEFKAYSPLESFLYNIECVGPNASAVLG